MYGLTFLIHKKQMLGLNLNFRRNLRSIFCFKKAQEVADGLLI